VLEVYACPGIMGLDMLEVISNTYYVVVSHLLSEKIIQSLDALHRLAWKSGPLYKLGGNHCLISLSRSQWPSMFLIGPGWLMALRDSRTCVTDVAPVVKKIN